MGNKGFDIIKQIEKGQDKDAVEDILGECTPSLNKLVSIAQKIDLLTGEQSVKAVRKTLISAFVGFVVIIVCLIIAVILSRKTGKKILTTILEPLHEIENAAKELNLREICTVHWSISQRMKLVDLLRVCVSQYIFWVHM